ncbi:FmdB family zinc ribbon protein [Mycobacterium sp. UM_Kg1]|uniref:FmdB family zinc ribbon protein n=1 Tax=Mycobacterium sp. UM_Kg1 TaxID=1545691 RepID=UPI00061B57D6|nr:FmdB family zinc ribbon protein [Mycobacterium sp. UM_Kg1]
MPTYSYACTECSNRFDVVQAFTDDALTNCEDCNGRLRKIFGKVGVVFKGSGFYRTDSREAGKSSSNGNGSSASAASTSSDSASSTSASADKSSASSSATSGSTAAAAPAAASS